MPNIKHAQCELIQLHIDGFLDGDLEPAREQEMNLHLDSCVPCRAELAYARRLHVAVTSLPVLNCPDQVLEPAHRLHATTNSASGSSGLSWWQQFVQAFAAAPAVFRYALPAVVTVLLLLGPGRMLLTPQLQPELAIAPNPVEQPPQYTQEQMLQAMADLDLALDYLSRISQRTSDMVQDRFLFEQLEASVSAGLKNVNELNVRSVERRTNGPI